MSLLGEAETYKNIAEIIQARRKIAKRGRPYVEKNSAGLQLDVVSLST
jgi:hypothetical protein